MNLFESEIDNLVKRVAEIKKKLTQPLSWQEMLVLGDELFLIEERLTQIENKVFKEH